MDPFIAVQIMTEQEMEGARDKRRNKGGKEGEGKYGHKGRRAINKEEQCRVRGQK